MARQREYRVVGIDPGFSGALAGLAGDEAVVVDMPVIGEKKDKVIDGASVYRTLVNSHADLIVIEQVGAMPGQGVVSMFNFGVAFGTVLGLATASGVRVHLVRPQVWKKKYGLLGKDKSAAIKEAYLRFPECRDRLTRKKDDGRAEALLLADYGRRFVLAS